MYIPRDFNLTWVSPLFLETHCIVSFNAYVAYIETSSTAQILALSVFKTTEL
jgi:hypothetical protein